MAIQYSFETVYARNLWSAVNRLTREDFTLKWINLWNENFTDEKVEELIDLLLLHPNIITHLDLSNNRLTDKTGLKLAHYVAISTTIHYVNLSNNHFGVETYKAMAEAWRVNTSLRELHLHGNGVEKSGDIKVAFIGALRANSVHPYAPIWHLFVPGYNEYLLWKLSKL